MYRPGGKKYYKDKIELAQNIDFYFVPLSGMNTHTTHEI